MGFWNDKMNKLLHQNGTCLIYGIISPIFKIILVQSPFDSYSGLCSNISWEEKNFYF